MLVKVLVPENAKRHNATDRKCRCEFADVVEIVGSDKAYSLYDESFSYEVGKRVTPTTYDPDRWNECSGGIHFFVTREEAEDWSG